MNILMLSQDKKIFEQGPVAARMASYGVFATTLRIVVFGIGNRQETNLSPNVQAVFPGGSHPVDAYIRGVREIFSSITALRPEIVSSQDPFFIGAAGIVAARLSDASFQAQLHTDCFSFAYAFSSPRRAVETFLAFFVILGSDCVRAVSLRIAKSIASFSRTPVSVLPIRVAEVLQQAFPKPKEFSDRFTVLSVARMTEEKQLHLLLDAVRTLPDIDVVLVGDGPLRNSLELRAKRLGIDARIKFAGWQNPHPYYAHAQAYVCTSRFEGYGMSLVEAALHALPIITTDVGIAGELLKDKEEVLVIQGNAVALRSALIKLAADSGLRATLGAAARKKAQATLVSESEYVARYGEALRTCASKTAS